MTRKASKNFTPETTIGELAEGLIDTDDTLLKDLGRKIKLGKLKPLREERIGRILTYEATQNLGRALGGDLVQDVYIEYPLQLALGEYLQQNLAEAQPPHLQWQIEPLLTGENTIMDLAQQLSRTENSNFRKGQLTAAKKAGDAIIERLRLNLPPDNKYNSINDLITPEGAEWLRSVKRCGAAGAGVVGEFLLKVHNIKAGWYHALKAEQKSGGMANPTTTKLADINLDTSIERYFDILKSMTKDTRIMAGLDKLFYIMNEILEKYERPRIVRELLAMPALAAYEAELPGNNVSPKALALYKNNIVALNGLFEERFTQTDRETVDMSWREAVKYISQHSGRNGPKVC